MKVIEINTICYGSTGNIMKDIGECCEREGDEVFYALPNGRHMKNHYVENFIPIGGKISQDIHLVLGRLLGLNGMFSIIATLRFIYKINIISPDIIHIHNLHKNFINIPIFFSYLKRNNISVVWTLHDCWSFTGRCPHYIISKCNKWKTGCKKCPYPSNEYPQSYINTTFLQWKIKKYFFSELQNLTIVTPSAWLAREVKSSFLKDHAIYVINNGIDTDVFRRVESEFRNQYDLIGINVILGVSMDWNYKKGLDIFKCLAKLLPDNYRIVLVGTSEEDDKHLPSEIISIHSINTSSELAEIYSMADVFVNPTREDTFPTVNIEALACGTPVITHDVCGCAEIIDTYSGIAVMDNINDYYNAILTVCEDKKFTEENCRKRALNFVNSNKFKEYINLFHKICLEDA